MCFFKCRHRKEKRQKQREKIKSVSETRIAWKQAYGNPAVVSLRARLCSAELGTVCAWRSCCDLMKNCLSFFSHIHHAQNILRNIAFTLS